MKIAKSRQSPVSFPRETSKPRQGGEAPRAGGGVLEARKGLGANGVAGNVTRRGGHCDNAMTVLTPRGKGDDFEPQRPPRLKLDLDPRKSFPGSGPAGGTEPSVRAMRGPGSSGRGGGDFVMLGERPDDLPGLGSGGPFFKVKPDLGRIRPPVNPITSVLQRLLQGWPKPPGGIAPPQVSLTPPPGADLGCKWSPIKTGDSHADNIFRGPVTGGGPAPGFRPNVQVGSLEMLLARLRDSDAQQHISRPMQFGHKPGTSRADNLLF